MRLEDRLDLALEIGKVERFFDEAADPLKLEKLLHRRTRTGQHDHRGLADLGLFFEVIMAVGTQLAKVGQPVLAFRDTDIEHHTIRLALFRLDEAFGALIGSQDLVAEMLELLFNNLANVIFVINDQKAFTSKKAYNTNRFYYSLSLISRKFLSFLERVGWRSFRSAFASIWRTRSRVTLKMCPTSSRVRG